MTTEKHNKPRTEKMHLRDSADGVTIVNDITHDALIYLDNAFWGPISQGYVRVGKSLTLPTIVNVDAYALFEDGEGVFMQWPGPSINYNVKKINLTPGQTYHLSDFD